jgi:hypothetical protein
MNWNFDFKVFRPSLESSVRLGLRSTLDRVYSPAIDFLTSNRTLFEYVSFRHKTLIKSETTAVLSIQTSWKLRLARWQGQYSVLVKVRGKEIHKNQYPPMLFGTGTTETVNLLKDFSPSWRSNTFTPLYPTIIAHNQSGFSKKTLFPEQSQSQSQHNNETMNKIHLESPNRKK